MEQGLKFNSLNLISAQCKEIILTSNHKCKSIKIFVSIIVIFIFLILYHPDNQVLLNHQLSRMWGLLRPHSYCLSVTLVHSRPCPSMLTKSSLSTNTPVRSSLRNQRQALSGQGHLVGFLKI